MFDAKQVLTLLCICVLGFSIAAGLHILFLAESKSCNCEPCFEETEKWVQLADECIRCRDHEAKNWQTAALDRIKELEECLDLKRIYEQQNMKWVHGEDKENQSCTCGPYRWTCEECTVRAAIMERGYNTCKYDGYFPGYTILDGWLDDYREGKSK